MPTISPDSEVTLPASSGLTKLADLRPAIVVDNREREPLPFTRFEARRFAAICNTM
jgi:hypothetical protein